MSAGYSDIFYHCADGKRLHKTKAIKQVNISEERLWKELDKIIGSIALTEDQADVIWQTLSTTTEQDEARKEKAADEAKLRLSELICKEDELYDHLSGGVLSKGAYARQIEKMKAERLELEGQISTENKLSNEQMMKTAQYLLELCKTAEIAWKNGNSVERLNLLKRFFSNLRLNGATVGYDLRRAFAVLAQMKLNIGTEKWCPLAVELRTAILAHDEPLSL